jgi:hypothetical protein
MNKQVVFLLFSLLAMAFVPACGGPSSPTSRIDELRASQGQGSGGAGNNANAGNAAGGGNAAPVRPSPAGGGKQDEKEDKEGQEGGEGEEGTGEGDSEEEGESEEEGAGEEAEEETYASPPGTSNVPSGLKRVGGGSAPGDDKIGEEKKNNKKKGDEKKQPPSENENSAGGVAETSEVVTRRFTFFERANQAFVTGNEFEAFQYLFAHVIAEDSALREHPIGWYTGISEPRVGLRWGVGVDYRPGNFTGDPPKFDRSTGSATGGGGGNTGSDEMGFVGGGGAPGGRDPTRRDPPPGGASSTKPDGKDPVQEFEYYTSLFGNKFVERVEMRRKNPDFFWGKALYDIDLSKKLKAPDGTRPGGDTRSAPEPSSGGGGIVDVDGGSAAPPSPPPSNNDEPVADTGFVPEFSADPTSLTPGVMMLGLGKNEELLEMARANGLDLVAVFYVSVQTSSKSDDKTTVSVTILDTKTGEVVAETKKINTTAYAKALSDGDDDPIEEELDKLFPQGADKNYKVAEWPNISADAAAKRVDKLLQQEPQNPLPALAEIRHYQEAGLITKTEFLSAAEALLGAENARKLVDGDITERELALKSWLPGQFKLTTPVRNDNNFR